MPAKRESAILPCPALLTAVQVAAVLAVSRKTVYALVHRGQLPRPVKVGRASRWRRRDLERLIDAHGRLDPPRRGA